MNAQVLHIDTIGCGIDVSDTSYLNKMVRHEGQLYNQMFNTLKNDTVTVSISLFGKTKDYTRVVKLNKLKANTNGAYSPALNRAFVYKNEIYLHVTVQAAGNILLHNNYPQAPKWLTEGIKAVMGNVDETAERKIVYLPLFDYNKQLKDLTWNGEIDFDSLFLDSNPDWDNKSAASQTLLPLSYGIIYFLITSDKDYLSPIVSSMKAGSTARDAFINTFGTFANFKTQFMMYYRYSAKSKYSMN